MKHQGSEITTSAKGASKPTGTPLGGHGAGTRYSSPAVAWLANQYPQDVDRELISRASQLGVQLNVRHRTLFPTDSAGNSLPSVMVVDRVKVMADQDAAIIAADRLAPSMTRPEIPDVEGWLAELSVLVPQQRGTEGFRAELQLVAYASRLATYPADVVSHALRRTSWRFWPSWFELEKLCDGLAQPRRAMMAAIERAAQGLTEEAEKKEERKRCDLKVVAELVRGFAARHAAAEPEVAPVPHPEAQSGPVA